MDETPRAQIDADNTWKCYLVFLSQDGSIEMKAAAGIR
jgi:hypothetical protein